MTLELVLDFLRHYPKPVKIMEVCGTHTSAIVKSGLRGMLSPNIRLVSGPGCPVCVTPATYIDTLVAVALQKNTCVLSFGDLFKVPGSGTNFAQAKAAGAAFQMIYSPLEAASLAQKNPRISYVVAAVGFETTAPLYAVLLEDLLRKGIRNVWLFTALKTMPAALDYLCKSEEIDGFLCPGHVAAITGSKAFEPLCQKYRKPFVIAGFAPELILAALYRILMQKDTGKSRVENLYKSAVTCGGNEKAQVLTRQYFAPADGFWRGIGCIRQSALILRTEYACFDAGSAKTGMDYAQNPACRCGDVMLGRIYPHECALFGSLCRPDAPVGACMVSAEGACGIWHKEMGGKL